MNAKTLFLFLILLFGLILCSFLGGRNCMTEGMTNNTNSQSFTSDNGSTATITDQNVLVFTDTSGFITKYVYSEDQNNQYGTTSTYTGPNGGTAVLFQGNNGISTIQITGPNGENMTTLTKSINNNNNQPDTGTADDSDSTNNDTSNTNYDNYNHYDKTSYPTIFYGPNGGTARIVKTHNNNTIITTSKNGTTEIFYINNNNPDVKVATYEGRNGDTAKVITTSNGKKAVAITTKDGSKIIFTADNTHVYNSQDQTINDTSDSNQYYSPNKEYTSYPAANTTYDSSMYYNSLPQGIPKSQIPPGQEDLYILKSEVVPPVCPACPEPIVQCPDNMDPSKVPPCPPCARCPEPAFDCKKVPNYNAFNPDYMPVPVLNDFSGFGM